MIKHLTTLIFAFLLAAVIFPQVGSGQEVAAMAEDAEDAAPGMDLPLLSGSDDRSVLPPATGILLPPRETPEVKRLNDLGFQSLQNQNGLQSLAYFKQAYLQDKKSIRARFGIGTAFIAMDRYRDALQVFEPLLLENPLDYALQNNVAWLLATAKDPAVRNPRRALRMAQDSLFQRTNEHHIWSTLAEAHYVCGQYERAFRAAAIAFDLAGQAKVNADAMEQYRRQLIKCREAVTAFSLLE